MGQISFSDFSGLVESFRNKDFKGFSLEHRDPRDIGQDLAKGRFEVDLYGTGYEPNSGLGDKISSYLDNRQVGVFADGQKLFETSVKDADLRVGGTQGEIALSSQNVLDYTDASTLQKLNPNLSIPEVDSGSFSDFFQALDVNKLSFRPVESAEDAVFRPQPVNRTKEKVQALGSKSLLLLLGLVVGAYSIYRGLN